MDTGIRVHGVYKKQFGVAGEGWTNLLDEAGDLNEMLNILVKRTFFELD